MPEHIVEIRKITIPVEIIANLNAQERYAYYILGHIFNELMTLQKLVLVAIPKHDEITAVRNNAEIAQLLLLFRLSGSKIYEFHSTINCQEVGAALRTLIFPERPDLRDALKSLNKAIDGARWLRRMRNGMGFHNPSFKEWMKYTTPNDEWVDDIIFVGKHSGNTFYDASASVAMHWMFDEYRNIPPQDAFEQLVGELIELMKKLNGVVEEILGTFVTSVLPGAVAQPAAVVDAPRLECVSLPYWIQFADAEVSSEIGN